MKNVVVHPSMVCRVGETFEVGVCEGDGGCEELAILFSMGFAKCSSGFISIERLLVWEG